MSIALQSLLVQSAYGIVFFHVVLVFIFIFVRLPLLNNVSRHYSEGSGRDILAYKDTSTGKLLFNSFFQSVMVQSGWGALDIIPVSVVAKTVHLTQTILSFLITAGTITWAANTAAKVQ